MNKTYYFNDYNGTNLNIKHFKTKKEAFNYAFDLAFIKKTDVYVLDEDSEILKVFKFRG